MAEFLITCTKENIQRGLARVTPLAGRNTQLPILSHILLESRGGVVHLTATDLENGVHTVAGGKTEGAGKVTIPARAFFSYVQQLPASNPITIQVKSSAVHISTNGFTAQFPIGNAEDFPLLPQGKRTHAINIPGRDFCRALEQVVFAAARDETRPEIRGVYVHIQGKKIRLAATDSFRLAEEVASFSGGQDASFILPLPAAQEVVRLFATQETISIAPQDNHILFFSDELDLTSRLVDGAYPDYRQIIPRSAKTTVRINREELLQALKTLVVFLPRDSRRVELAVNPKEGVLSAQVAGGGAGEGDVAVAADVKGEAVSVLLNIQYLLEGLQHLAGEQCVIEFGGEANPMVMRPDTKQGEYVYVVMPIRA